MGHHNVYSQHGCIGCKPCEGGAGNIGRGTVLWSIGIFTCGMGLIFLPFFKKCQYCGHNAFMNAHHGPDLRGSSSAVNVNVNANISAALSGYAPIAQQPAPQPHQAPAYAAHPYQAEPLGYDQQHQLGAPPQGQPYQPAGGAPVAPYAGQARY